MHDRLRVQWRDREDRDDAPSAGYLGFPIDSQLLSRRGHRLRRRRESKGSQRSLIVDTLGLLLAVSISAASVQDRDAADDVVVYSKEKYPSLNTLFVDSAYWGNGQSACIKRTRSTFK
jgi:putative transposase